MRKFLLSSILISLVVGSTSFAAGSAAYVLGQPSKYSFTDCVLKSAASKSDGEFFNYVGSDAEDKTPVKFAKIYFLTKTADSKYHQYEVSLTADNSEGWQYVQDSDGEIALYTTSFSTNARVSSKGSSSSEIVDISSCK